MVASIAAVSKDLIAKYSNRAANGGYRQAAPSTASRAIAAFAQQTWRTSTGSHTAQSTGAAITGSESAGGCRAGRAADNRTVGRRFERRFAARTGSSTIGPGASGPTITGDGSALTSEAACTPGTAKIAAIDIDTIGTDATRTRYSYHAPVAALTAGRSSTTGATLTIETCRATDPALSAGSADSPNQSHGHKVSAARHGFTTG